MPHESTYRKDHLMANKRTIAEKIGQLPEGATMDILGALKLDSKFELGELLRSTDLTPEQVATAAAALAHSNQWHGRLDLFTRDRIRHITEQAFTPIEQAPADPIAESAQRAHGAWDPWTRHSEIHDPRHVVTVGGLDALGIVDTREES